MNKSVGSLSFQQRIAIERQLLARSKGQRLAISRGKRDGPQPLSFAQRRLWFLEQLEGELTAYNIPQAWKLHGRLNADALQRALEAIVQRHEPLRTTFAVIDDEPVQVIGKIDRFELPVEDLSCLKPDQQRNETEGRCRFEAEQPFDLACDPMLRARLLKLAEDDHVLLLTMHHLASDGWSFGVLWRELKVLYDVFCQGAAPQLPELPVQYADYAIWQRGELQGPRLERLLQYWREHLDGISALELPTDHPRPPALTYRGAGQAFEIGSELVEQLKSLSQAEGVTLQMTLLAAFQVLLARYSGQDDIAVGTPIAGRNHLHLEDQIGFFVNTLVLRTDLSGDPTFRELLGRVREVSLEAYDHQDLPFEKLVEEVHPQRHVSRSPLVQVMFQLTSFADTQLALRELEVSRLPSSSHRTRFDLEMHVRQHANQLRGTVVFSTDLFEPETIERIARHFVTLLSEIVSNPDQSIRAFQLLTERERHQLLVQWNGTAVEFAGDLYVHELFEAQVEQTPDAVAVAVHGREFTYQELNERANQLAHHLQSLGVGPNMAVGLCMGRCLEMMIGVLGVAKAGAAWLSLDPTHPAERLDFMVRDAQIRVLLARECTRSIARGLSTSEIVELDKDWDAIQRHPRTTPPNRLHPDDLAYIIYTSGSTGSPKGVQLTHRGLRNVARCQQMLFGPTVGNRVLHFASVSFDASVFEFAMALTSGATLCLTPTDVPLVGPRLVNVLREMQITHLTIPPSSLDTVPVSELPDLTVVCIVGEACSSALARRWAAEGRRVFNLYGPTEATIWATAHECTTANESPPIGRPICNTQAYVLDERQQLVPAGVPGELYLSGAGLARGYLGLPQLTAENFVPNPFDEDPHARMYRTGDRCRWRYDGNLEFLGRLDEQVKLRGFRIELGEIESALNERSDVAQSAVALHEDHAGDKRLVAYCLAAADTELHHPDLRNHLQERVPDYMLPSSFVDVETFPLTPSGKIDRRALPSPPDSRPRLGTGYCAPRNAIEQHLTSIWCDLLGLESIGVHDDFFELGGHSLLATQVNARICATLEVDLPLRRLFESPTIAALACDIELHRCDGKSSQRIALQRVDRDQLDRLPLSYAQQRLWFLEQLEAQLTAYNMAFAWRLAGKLDVAALRRALEAVVCRHEPLRTAFAVINGEPVQVIRSINRFELPMEDLSSVQPERRPSEVKARCRLEAERPFDLSRDLMMRASLLRVAADDHVLLLTLHHIAGDGWSMDILWRELRILYDAYGRGVEPNLPELTIRYADYALWQRNELQGEKLAGLLRYWRDQLEGVRPLELPTDRPRPPLPTYQGARCTFELDRELLAQLKLLSRTEGVTLQMTLLAAFQTLLSRYSGQDDFAVGTPTAGRNHPALEDQVGFFINTLVLRANLADDPTFRQLLQRVRKVSLEAYDHQELPFEKLVEEIHPDRDPSRSPLIQVLFQLLNLTPTKLGLGDLEVTGQPSTSHRVRFDLEMHLSEHQQSVVGNLVYSSDLFDHATIERLVVHYVTLVKGIVADADRQLSELPLLSELERDQLLVHWNDTAADYPHDRCLHELFEEQVERTPNAVAVVFEAQRLSFNDLNLRANQLAHHLRAMGVGPRTMVGVCLHRSPELIVSVLAILKAGGAYLPLDPALPSERTRFMLADARPSAVVTTGSLLDAAIKELEDGDTTLPTVRLDYDADQLASRPGGNLQLELDPAGPAYVIYTSGSSGPPKGVLGRHQSTVNRLCWMWETYPFEPRDVCCQKTTLSFVDSVWEMFGPLLQGVPSILIPDIVVRDPQRLVDVLAEQQVTRIVLVPSLLTVLFDSDPTLEKRLPRLTHWVCSGERLTTELVARFREQLPRSVLINLYGSSEVADDVTCFDTRAPHDGDAIPIGRPIFNTQVYVLEGRQNLVPIGVPGELYVSGAGLAVGYLNRPQLTAEKFVANPFNEEPNSRLYRTGDRCRWRADGNLEFLGRLDDQVKLRGFRIELGEVESVLHEHPAIRQSLVVLREDEPGDEKLVAYYVAADKAALTVSDLIRQLRTKLPEHMVPSAFVAVDAFPLTPSGKVLRRALPAPDDSRPRLASAFVPPRNAIEQQLAEIWGEVLDIDGVGIHDDFFDLGGHSLLAVRLFSRIEEAFGTKLPLAVLFQHGTISRLGRLIVNADPAPAVDIASVLTLREGGEGRPLYLMPTMAGGFGFRELIESFHGRHPVFGIQPALAPKNIEQFRDFRTTARGFVNALRSHQAHGPYALAGYCYGGLMAYEVACLLDDIGEKVDVLAVIEAGPGNGRLNESAADKVKKLFGIGANLPSWLREESRQFSTTSFTRRAYGKMRRLYRLASSGGQAKIQPDDVFHVARSASQNRELMQTVFAASRDYRPQPYAGKVTLFRAKTRPLLRGASQDLGWSRFAGSLEIHDIDGNHETILQPPHVGELARQLEKLL